MIIYHYVLLKCKITSKLHILLSMIIMIADFNRFIVSTIGENIYFHCGNEKISSMTIEKGVYQILIGKNGWITGNEFIIKFIVEN